MKAIYIVVSSLVLLLGAAVSFSYASTEKYGEAISSRTVTAIKDILADPKAYDGKTITIEGTIESECEDGCWFYVKVADSNAVIYVDIEPAGFAIPQNVGHKVLVEGKVVVKKTGPMILGKGVEVR